MKGKDIVIGGVYAAKVSGSIAPVRIDGVSQYGGWNATNLRTKHAVHIKSAARLRYEVKADAPAPATTVDAPAPPARESRFVREFNTEANRDIAVQRLGTFASGIRVAREGDRAVCVTGERDTVAQAWEWTHDFAGAGDGTRY